ncbi:MAG: DMT family transporter [Candidatus Zixiibacteriota bacterium]|nr:MAG: DMT family transporter [candidate division Zixibacteria bacterium]
MDGGYNGRLREIGRDDLHRGVRGSRKTYGFVYAALAVHTLFCAGTYLVAKGAVVEIAPLVFAFYRFLVASAVFIVIIAFRKSFFPFEKKDLPMLLLLSFLIYPVNQTFFLIGISYTLPTHAALLYASTPVWVYLLSILRKEEKSSHGKTIGIAVALAGVIAFFAEKGIALKWDYFLGNFLVMIAVWAWAAYSVLGKPLVKKWGAFTVTAWASIIGALIYSPLGIYQAAGFDYTDVGIVGWSGVAYTAILTSVIAYTLWYWGIKHFSPSRVAVFMYLQPVVAAILAYYILYERLSSGSIISGLIILAGVSIAQRD